MEATKMKWNEFFGTLSDEQRNAARAALRSANQETPQQEADRLRAEVETKKRAIGRLRVDEARSEAERFAEQRNRAAGGAL
jgi:hypothetical protein